MADIFSLFDTIKSAAAPRAPVSWIIAGLGNPGAQYENTRHNVGFRALDNIAGRAGVRVDRLRFQALTGECTFTDTRVLLMKPQTFMNLSGESVFKALSWYHIEPERLIVLYDDAALPPGRIRVRGEGSDGGHNGIKSILEHLKTDTYPRVKIGGGSPPHPEHDLADWELSKISGKEIDGAIDRTASAAACIIREGLESAMGQFNAPPAE